MQQPKGVSMGLFDAITSPIASLASGALGFLGQQGANATNQANAQAQMDFQRDMSNTSYQRAVEDMKAAGLSPMLAYSQGGASVPSGQMAISQNKLGAGVEAFQKSIGTSSAAELAKADVANKQSQVTLNTAQADKAMADADFVRAQTGNQGLMGSQIQAMTDQLKALSGLHGANASKISAEISNIKESFKEIQERIEQLRLRNKIDKPAANFAEDNPKWAEYLDPVTKSINTIVNGLSGFRGNSGVTNTTTTHPSGAKTTTTTTRSR